MLLPPPPSEGEDRFMELNVSTEVNTRLGPRLVIDYLKRRNDYSDCDNRAGGSGIMTRQARKRLDAEEQRRYQDFQRYGTTNAEGMRIVGDHVYSVVKHLVSTLGPGDWCAPPRTARAIAAWNELLYHDDCFVEPHVPGQTELSSYHRFPTRTERIEHRISTLYIQHRNRRVGDKFDAVRSRRFDQDQVHSNYCNVTNKLFNILRDDVTNNGIDADTVRMRKGFIRDGNRYCAERTELDWERACKEATEYAPHGVSLVITMQRSDDEVFHCSDPKFVVARIATYMFIEMHAHHIRALDVRCTGCAVKSCMPVSSSLIMEALHCCTQVRCLRGTDDGLVTACAASLGTTSEIVEVFVRNKIHLLGKDVGRVAAPYACNFVAQNMSIVNSGIEYTWTDRIVNRVSNYIEPMPPDDLADAPAAELGLPSLEVICNNQVESYRQIVNTLIIARDMCVREDLRHLEIANNVVSDDVMLPFRRGMTVTDLRYFLEIMFAERAYNDAANEMAYFRWDFFDDAGDEFTPSEKYPNLRVLRLVGAESVDNEDYQIMTAIVSKGLTPKLECLALLEGIGTAITIDDCEHLTGLVKALPDCAQVLEINCIPVTGRTAFVEAVAAKGIRVFHAFGDRKLAEDNKRRYLYCYKVPDFDMFYPSEDEEEDDEDEEREDADAAADALTDPLLIGGSGGQTTGVVRFRWLLA